MTMQITHLEAWADFYAWAHIPQNWRVIDRPGRDQIAKAARAAAAGRLGFVRVKSLLEKYGPAGRYEFREAVFLNI